jgi:hypothetical protein
MDIGEDSWEHVPPLLLNCGQEDSDVGGHEEYLHNTEEVSDCISLITARSTCMLLTAVELNLSDKTQVVCVAIFEEKKAFVTSLMLENSTVINLVWILGLLCFIVISNSQTGGLLLVSFYSSQHKVSHFTRHTVI